MKRNNTATTIVTLLAFGGIIYFIVLPVFASLTQGPHKPLRDVVALIIVIFGAGCIAAAIFISLNSIYKQSRTKRDNK